MKACVFTLGCKVNQCESFALVRRLEELGWEVTESLSEDCELYVLNTCAVTNEGERKSRQVFHRLAKAHPRAKIVVCGCASQKEPDKFLAENGLVLGTMGKFSIPGRLAECGVHIAEEERFDDSLLPKNVRTRAYVKVQDGCNNFCSYCIVPYLRGRSRSRTPESVLAEIRENTGTEEIVLTGINLSDYGRGVGSSLPELLEALSGTDKRVRLGSLEVGAVTRDLLGAAKKLARFCPQFHLSLQSGSDRVLRDMNRKYTREEYLARCALIREYFPDAALTTDVIVGFPTETEEDFEETLDLVRRAGFFEMHVFPYSRRKGTRAESLGMLGKEVVSARLARLGAVAEELKKKYLSGLVGETLEVLGETLETLGETEEEGLTFGHARNYAGVYVPGAPIGLCCQVKITSLFRDGLKGERI